MAIPQVLLIQRKDTLGYMDIMRGKYKLTDIDYISKQLKGITYKERDALLHGDFNEMWDALWNSDTESIQRYSHNKAQSLQKLDALRKGIQIGSEVITLEDLLRQDPVLYDSPEWGFPKGRRDNRETDSVCAFRELFEETSIRESEVLRVTNIEPFVEQFYGSNNIHYRHIYFLAFYVGQRDIEFDHQNSQMTREISNISWKNIDEALLLLRPDNLEKKGILIQLGTLLRNYSPVLREPLVGENKGEEQQDKYVFQRISRTGVKSRTFGGGSSE
jgi:8-oxo-dGTP pyrophosphatase MutT (NUDIX family)